MAVSTYFYLKAHGREFKVGFGEGEDLEQELTVDEYVVRMIDILCQWVSIRYLLHATGHTWERSTFFWYDDGMSDPFNWHRSFLGSVGMQMPLSVVSNATNAALRNDFGFKTKGGLDEHPGAKGVAKNATSRSYKDEVRPDTLRVMDDAMRTWLPPVLQTKFGMTPADERK